MKKKLSKISAKIKKKVEDASLLPDRWHENFQQAMQAFLPFEEKPHMAVACSGGADSLALSLLLQKWLEERGGRLTALIIDHQLRLSSAKEARMTASFLRAKGIETVIMTMEKGWLKAGNMHAQAREYRYKLMAEWCRDRGVLHLFLGHNAADHGETFLERLYRGSGLDGLCAIPARRFGAHCRFLRPLLSLDGQEIRNRLTKASIPFIEDKSNHDSKFLRARLRGIYGEMKTGGFTDRRMALATNHLAGMRHFIETLSDKKIARHLEVAPEGYGHLAIAAFDAMEEQEGVRFLSSLIAFFSGKAFRPKYQNLRKAFTAIFNQGKRNYCLGGCRLHNYRGRLFIFRHLVGLKAEDTSFFEKEGRPWDGRFRLQLPASDGLGLYPGLYIRALGKKDARIFFTKYSAQAGVFFEKEAFFGKSFLSRLAGPSLPALFSEKGLEMVGSGRGWLSLEGEKRGGAICFAPIFRLGFSASPSILPFNS